ncbi:interleukin-22 [Ornithorhynchus anatinus]|uniref:interleukin-22 n=1 Tax=Ornithorhynchus anatinus TaxID=9258 RepID=UPI0000EDF4F2|nr:interleukin-22 [Ornithorhynchus anatinus]
MASPKGFLSCCSAWTLASCSLFLFLLVLTSQGAVVPLRDRCRLKNSDFEVSFINQRILNLSKKASDQDTITDIRLINSTFPQDVQVGDRCYLMKQILNFTLEVVIPPQYTQLMPFIQDVESFFSDLHRKLRYCNTVSGGQHVESHVETLKKTVTKLGKKGMNKVIGELNLLFMALKHACV